MKILIKKKLGIESNNGERIGKQQKEIAEKIKVNRAGKIESVTENRISQIESANGTKIGYSELVCFREAMGITCDELITGIKPQNKKLSETAGLSDKSIELLRQMNEHNPDYIAMLNIIFEDENTAALLLDALLLYANQKMISIKVGEIEGDFPLMLSDSRQNELIKMFAQTYLVLVLEKTQKDWDDAIGWKLDSAAQHTVEKAELWKKLGEMNKRVEAIQCEIAEAKIADDITDDEL